ncbi:hypothetical protein XENOCAPTIV_007509 [Xenoophorus captivus]|uniref:Uncharacterized protein n=1 Tax=Xenoophorus captivus TaxID=1517983 RepID=A0ABV0RBY9_9TELE
MRDLGSSVSFTEPAKFCQKRGANYLFVCGRGFQGVGKVRSKTSRESITLPSFCCMFWRKLPSFHMNRYTAFVIIRQNSLEISSRLARLGLTFLLLQSIYAHEHKSSSHQGAASKCK